jgi:hypothetical protein
VLAALPAAAFASPSNKWRIQCSEGAKSDGEIVFRLAPEGAEAIEVTVPVAKGTSENGVARRIRDVLRQQLDGEKFHVEVDDGEDVLVKKRSGQPDFDLALVRVTVAAVRIRLDRE